LQVTKTGTLLVRVMVMVLVEHGKAELCPMEDVMLAALIFNGRASPEFTAVVEEVIGNPAPVTLDEAE